MATQYKNFPGGEECFCRFLSCGNAGTEPGQSIGQGMAASGAAAMAEDFLLGERYIKSPELVKKFVASSAGHGHPRPVRRDETAP